MCCVEFKEIVFVILIFIYVRLHILKIYTKKMASKATPKAPSSSKAMAASTPTKIQKPGNGHGNVEGQLREEIQQLTAALEETDQALDEWVAECERLQGVIKSKENEMKSVGEQLEELKQYSLKMEEERKTKSPLRAQPAKQESTSSKAVEDLKRENESLKVQLAQAQQWVKDGLAKIEQANAITESEKKKVATAEKEKEGLLKGQKGNLESERDKAVFEASRLGNVVHAHELELAKLRSALQIAKEDLREAEALAGKSQALCTVAKFQAECSSTDNDALVHWLKSAVRWSSRL